MNRTCLTVLCWAALFRAAGQPAAPVAISLGGYSESLHAPARVATGPEGAVYVTDPQAGQVVVFDPFGRRVATRDGFARPLGIAVDEQGRIYLAEEAWGRVSVFDAGWNLLGKLGSGDGEFQLPNHIALGPGSSDRAVYVSDSKANAVKVYIGAAPSFQFGTPGGGDGQFDFPAGLCVGTNGEVFVVDQNNDRVQVFDRAGGFMRAFSLGSSRPSGRAQAACLDPLGRFYVADAFQGLVKVFDAASGTALSSLGGFGPLPGQLASPAGLALDPLNRLFVASANHARVELYGVDAFLHLTSQPAGSTVAAGTDLVFRVVPGGVTGFTCQWLKNGRALDSATNTALGIAGAGGDDTGGYSVVVTHGSETFTSGVTRVAVLLAPRLLSSPQSLTVLRGSNVVLAAIAEGSALHFQWQLNGLNVEGATHSTLPLPDVQTFQAGLYSVEVSNAVGRVLSAPATLTVLTPPAVMEIVSSAMATNQWFHLVLNADPGFGYWLEASGDLRLWQTLTNFTPEAGLFEFTDTDAARLWNRFYRLRWEP